MENNDPIISTQVIEDLKSHQQQNLITIITLAISKRKRTPSRTPIEQY